MSLPIDRGRGARLTLVTAPAAEPLSTAEAKTFLRVDHSSEDTLIASLVKAAREVVEFRTSRALVTQTWDLSLERFPAPGWALQLPKAPLQSVTSVTYVDTDGATQTWSADDYTVDAPSGELAERGLIVPDHGVDYPDTQGHFLDVTVRFVAGYGDAADVPGGLLEVMRLLMAHWYDNRTPVVTGTSSSIASLVPESIDLLLHAWKLDKVVIG